MQALEFIKKSGKEFRPKFKGALPFRMHHDFIDDAPIICMHQVYTKRRKDGSTYRIAEKVIIPGVGIQDVIIVHSIEKAQYKLAGCVFTNHKLESDKVTPDHLCIFGAV